MHEMSLAEGILQVLEDSARRQSFERVKTVWLEIGALANVEVESLRFCFDAVVRDSIAAGARLEILERPGQAWCHPCGRAVTVRALYEPCPQCAGYQLQVTGGTEMRVKEVEVE